MRMSKTLLIALALCAACNAAGDRVSSTDVHADVGEGHDADAAPDGPILADALDGEDPIEHDANPDDVDATPDVVEPPERVFTPSPARLHRLSADQLRSSIVDLLGVETTSPLEADTSLHGFVSVAGSELTIAPRTAEQLETLAWEAAEAIQGDADRRAAVVGCDPSDAYCLRDWILRFGRRVWRRPLTAAELEQIHATSDAVTRQFSDSWAGVGAAIAVFLQSPHFVFRVEIGEQAPERPGWRRYTSWEMAARLSYFLWGTTPDAALLEAAERGDLVTDEGLLNETTRMLDDPRARVRLTGFFDEFIGLQRLEAVTKDPDLFPEFDAALRDSMRREVHRLFDDVVFERRADFREILTSNTTFVDPALASLYGVEFPGSADIPVELPGADGRGGLLGRAALLSLFSHATLTSPTYRGRFVRSGLLCHDVPPPPDGVVTELPEPDGTPQTLRQRLEVHATEPLCAGCHDLMDPLGFPMEGFDPVGRVRDNDNGLPIDSSGELDGILVANAAELGAAVAEHAGFGPCVSTRLYRHATGHLETLEELPLLDDLADGFTSDEFEFLHHALRIVLSDGFRFASVPRGVTCDERGATRECRTACGMGVEECSFGEWTGCSAEIPERELCNGVDDDCDGAVDEAVIERCVAACGPGTATCIDGGWGACEGAPPAAEICDGLDQDCDGEIDEDVPATEELCDGLDQDCDGRIDEAIPSRTLTMSFWDLALSHPDCSPASGSLLRACNAAINRRCRDHACAATGFGPIELGGSEAAVACLNHEDVNVRETTYTELSGHHGGCHGGTLSGSDCNAAMHRWCAARGETSGYGPLEHGSEAVWVACVPDARIQWTTYTELGGFHDACPLERVGPNCNAAINRYCQSLGHLTGFGPIENLGDEAVVSCIPRP